MKTEKRIELERGENGKKRPQNGGVLGSDSVNFYSRGKREWVKRLARRTDMRGLVSRVDKQQKRSREYETVG